MSDAYTIRAFEPGDRDSLLACFRASFEGTADAEPRTRAEWEWAFERNPAGQRIFVALSGGAVVAQYAALPQTVWIDAAERTFAQIVDSMVHPEHRAGLQQPGLFVRTARAFFEAYGGRDRDLVHFGWPVAKALRIGARYLRYEIVRTQTVLVRPLGGGSTDTTEARVVPRVVPIERFDEQARWLWDRCAGAFGASAIRDAAYLNWRFADHPKHAYRRLGVRDAQGVLRGYAIWRLADWGRPEPVRDLALVVDWLVPPAEPEVGELLLAGVAAEARARLATALVALFPEWSPWFARFQETGFRVHPTDYALVARNFDARFGVHWLREHWWHQLGDSDLV